MNTNLLRVQESCKDRTSIIKYTGTVWHKYFTTEEEGSVRHLAEHSWERPIFNLFHGLLSRGHVTSSACGFQVLKKATGWDTRSSQIGKLSHRESAVPLDVALILGPSISSTVIVLVWASVRGSWEVLQQIGQQCTYFVPRWVNSRGQTWMGTIFERCQSILNGNSHLVKEISQGDQIQREMGEKDKGWGFVGNKLRIDGRSVSCLWFRFHENPNEFSQHCENSLLRQLGDKIFVILTPQDNLESRFSKYLCS